MKHLYIGAGLDIKITKLFPEVENFVFVDTQPRNPFDDSYDLNETIFKNPYFVEYLVKKAIKYKFELISKKILKVYSEREITNPTLLVFKSNTQTINYYISSNFRKDNLQELTQEIKECNSIIIKGFAPHYSIINLLQPSTICYFMSNTCYWYEEDPDPCDVDNLVQRLYHNDYFDKKFFVNQKTKEFIECKTIREINDEENKLNFCKNHD